MSLRLLSMHPAMLRMRVWKRHLQGRAVARVWLVCNSSGEKHMVDCAAESVESLIVRSLAHAVLQFDGTAPMVLICDGIVCHRSLPSACVLCGFIRVAYGFCS